MSNRRSSLLALLCFIGTATALAQWPAAQSPAIPEADGYVLIPGAALRPNATHVYKAIFEATRSPADPTQLLPALNSAGSELNALAVEGVPKQNRKFVVVFYGPAVDGILDDAHYRAKHGVGNPNLPVLAAMRSQGVALYVCGQNLAAAKIDPKTLASEITVASDAFVVLMTFENDGYALLSY